MMTNFPDLGKTFTCFEFINYTLLIAQSIDNMIFCDTNPIKITATSFACRAVRNNC